MNPIRVLIADDEQPARGTIRLILKQIDNIEVVGECSNGEDCIQFVKDNPSCYSRDCSRYSYRLFNRV